MSAQALNPIAINVVRPIKEQATKTIQRTMGYPNDISRLPSEVVYQICFAQEPTPEQIAKELYLLECD